MRQASSVNSRHRGSTVIAAYLVCSYFASFIDTDSAHRCHALLRMILYYRPMLGSVVLSLQSSADGERVTRCGTFNPQVCTNGSTLCQKLINRGRRYHHPSHRVVSAKTAARLETCAPCRHLTEVLHLPRLRLLVREFMRCLWRKGAHCSIDSIS